MKDPLRKRFPRELKEEAGKYLVIFILMVFSIALQSGYIVGGKSMIKAYDDSFEKYNIEDGNFSVKKKMNKSVLSYVEGYGIKVYENFYVTLKDDNNKEYRLFRNRSEVNRIDVLYGRLPEGIDEIALDRAFCDNNHLELGDEIVAREKTFTLVGKVALSDYSTMFASNDDMMFDAVNFTIALVSDECFDSFKDVTYNYAFKYNEAPKDTIEEKEMADALSKNLSSQVV
ncbi:MAG: ABC transporter permease, partial [Erysipelotrichaceae bacterium]|nr:ABC transporter permease [Erysipelotrichaceae bacterium]